MDCCGGGTGDNVVNVAEAGKAIDIRLVRVCGKRVHEKESTPNRGSYLSASNLHASCQNYPDCYRHGISILCVPPLDFQEACNVGVCKVP